MLLTNLMTAFANLVREDAACSATLFDPDDTAILAIRAHPDLSIRDLAALLKLSHSGGVRVVDRLHRAGHVERMEGEDRRTVALALTDAGQNRVETLLRQREGTLMALLGGLSDVERAQLETLLVRLLDGAAADRMAAWRLCRLCDHTKCENARCPVGGHLP